MLSGTSPRNGTAELFGLAPGTPAAEDVDALVAGHVEIPLAVDMLVSLRSAALLEVGDDVEKGHVFDHAQRRAL